jgi:hypothetical protein
MSRKHFSLLLAVTLVVAAAVLLIPGKTSRDSDVQHVLLIPDLQKQVNDLDRLRVSGPGGEPIATLLRGDGSWRVEETNGYRADWNQIRTLLADLAQAEVVERKTANPDYYTRLGVEDTSAPDATGVMLEFEIRRIGSIRASSTLPTAKWWKSKSGTRTAHASWRANRRRTRKTLHCRISRRDVKSSRPGR